MDGEPQEKTTLKVELYGGALDGLQVDDVPMEQLLLLMRNGQECLAYEAQFRTTRTGERWVYRFLRKVGMYGMDTPGKEGKP